MIKENKEFKNDGQANDPAATYHNKKLTFFSTFEEADEYEYKQNALLTPEQALNLVHQIRIRLYPQLDLRSKLNCLKIHFN